MTGQQPRWRSGRSIGRIFGRDPRRHDLVTGCRQCGAWRSVLLLRLGPRRLRWWCLHCGAVVRMRGPVELRERAQLRPTPAPTAPVAATPDQPDLAEVMPAAMVRWVGSLPGRPITWQRLDKSTIYRLYRRWDAHLAQQEQGAVAPPAPPSFSTVVGALHDACYDLDAAVRALAGDAPAPVRAAVRERAGHARRWLAEHRDEHCWIVRLCPAEGPVQPDGDLVKTAADRLRQGARPDPPAADAARAAAFGTTGGPALGVLLAVYPAERLAAALDDWLATGARPLRDEAMARLEPQPPRSVTPPDATGVEGA